MEFQKMLIKASLRSKNAAEMARTLKFLRMKIKNESKENRITILEVCRYP